jgi:hypothetical protein
MNDEPGRITKLSPDRLDVNGDDGLREIVSNSTLLRLFAPFLVFSFRIRMNALGR